MLPMKDDVTTFFKKRVSRIVWPFIAWNFVYAVFFVLYGGDTPLDAVKNFFGIFLQFGANWSHMWYIYMILGLYLLTPIISPWLERASKKQLQVYGIIWLLTTLLPYLHRYVAPELWGECFWNGFHALWYCSGYLGYLVLAHYIRFHLTWSAGKRIRIGLACFVVGAAFTAWSFWLKGVPGVAIETPALEWSWEFCTLNVLMATYGLFLVFSTIQKPAPRLITSLAKLSFGMYLMHLFFLAPIAAYFVNGNPAEPIIPVWAAIPAITVLSFVCCAVTTKLVSLLPGSKWIVG